MRVQRIFCLPMLAASVSLVQAQESRVAVEMAVSTGVVSAQKPYRTDPLASGRFAVIMHPRSRLPLEIAGQLIGSVGVGDSFGEPPLPRPLPNTVGISMGCLCRIGASAWSASLGLGAYHVAGRAFAPGGTSLGMHVGVQRIIAHVGPGSVLVDGRMLLLPRIGGSRVWLAQVGLVFRSR